jgi:hypothetical protein
MDNYKRIVTLSKDSLEYIAKVSPVIELDSSRVNEVTSKHPIQPLVEMMRLIEKGEYYERAQNPDYDAGVCSMIDERHISVGIKVDSSYLKSDDKLFEQMKYLVEIFKDRHTDGNVEVFASIKCPSGTTFI